MRDGIDKIDDLLIQEGLLKKEPVQELTRDEVERLMDACIQMRSDKVETLNACLSLNAFFIAALSLIVAVTTMVLTLSDVNSIIILSLLAALVFFVIAGSVIIFFMNAKTTKRNAAKADRYRDAYIRLRFLQEEDSAS